MILIWALPAFSMCDSSADLLPIATSVDKRRQLEYILPLEISEKINDFLSYRPSFVHPQCYVQTSDVLAVIGASKELRSAALK